MVRFCMQQQTKSLSAKKAVTLSVGGNPFSLNNRIIWPFSRVFWLRASGATQSDLLITPNSLTAARCWGVQLCAGVLVNKQSFIFFPSRAPRSCLDRHRLTFVSISGYSNRRETRDVRESLCYIRCTFYVVGYNPAGIWV